MDGYLKLIIGLYYGFNCVISEMEIEHFLH